MKRHQMVAATLALAILPAMAAAQQDSSRRTTTERGGAVSRGGRGGQRGNMGLSSDQLTQFQQSLSDMGCYRGTADGIMGPQTRQAIACARQKNNLQGNNMNELFRSMSLDMTVQDSMGMDVMGSSSRGRRGGNDPEHRMRDTTGGAGGSATADSGTSGRRGNAGTRGRGGNNGNAGRRAGRDSGATRPPRP